MKYDVHHQSLRDRISPLKENNSIVADQLITNALLIAANPLKALDTIGNY